MHVRREAAYSAGPISPLFLSTSHQLSHDLDRIRSTPSLRLNYSFRHQSDSYHFCCICWNTRTTSLWQKRILQLKCVLPDLEYAFLIRAPRLLQHLISFHQMASLQTMMLLPKRSYASRQPTRKHLCFFSQQVHQNVLLRGRQQTLNCRQS